MLTFKLQEEVITGRIICVLQHILDDTRIAVLEVFQVSATRHGTFDMPFMTRRHGEHTFVVVPVLVSSIGLFPISY